MASPTNQQLDDGSSPDDDDVENVRLEAQEEKEEEEESPPQEESATAQSSAPNTPAANRSNHSQQNPPLTPIPIAPYPYPYPYAQYPPGMQFPYPVQAATSLYTDASTMSDPPAENRRNRGGVSDPFPEKLHRMLTVCEQEGLGDIASFYSHGRAFCIHKPKRFEEQVMKRFFSQTKMSSFQRQLNLCEYMY